MVVEPLQLCHRYLSLWALVISGLRGLRSTSPLAGGNGVRLGGRGWRKTPSFRLDLAQKTRSGAIILNNSSFFYCHRIVVFIVGQIFTEPSCEFIGASDENVPMHSLSSHCSFGSLFQTLTSGLNIFIRSMGYPKAALVRSFVRGWSISRSAGFIMKFGWGIKGAAWATVDRLSWVCCPHFFLRRDSDPHSTSRMKIR